MSKKSLKQLCRLIDEEVRDCQKSAEHPLQHSEYAIAFNVTGIVLSHLAKKIRKEFKL